MKFIVDSNLPPALARWLESEGYEAASHNPQVNWSHRHIMRFILVPLLLIMLASVSQAQQNFVTVNPRPESHAWWLRAEFHPFGTSVRGIPVATIRKSWCKANEYTNKLMASVIIENGTDTVAANGLAFAVEGRLDGSKTKQTALVGVYRACAGETGAFLLIIDQSPAETSKIRFVHESPSKHQFAALSLSGSTVLFWTCMECDNVGRLRWDRSKRRFAWLSRD